MRVHFLTEVHPSYFIQNHMLNRIPVLFILVLLTCGWNSAGQENSPLKEGAKACLRCHGEPVYTLINSFTDQSQKKMMNPYLIIDSVKFHQGVHRTFNCTDCHDSGYETYPHSADLKMMPMANCLDCHGGDDTYAKYQFERIDEEFIKSIHVQHVGDKFTCSSCHDQHYYQSVARNASTVQEIVDYNNGMCMGCHGSTAKYLLLTDKMQRPLNEIHDWLPNQQLHFDNVRCIECHTQVTDTLMVSHNILAKEQARKNCSECHSANSVLRASLYKYENLQSRSGKGTLNAVIQNESYIIGANQVPALKILSIIFLVLALAGIFTHSFFRFLKK